MYEFTAAQRETMIARITDAVGDINPLTPEQTETVLEHLAVLNSPPSKITKGQVQWAIISKVRNAADDAERAKTQPAIVQEMTEFNGGVVPAGFMVYTAYCMSSDEQMIEEIDVQAPMRANNEEIRIFVGNVLARDYQPGMKIHSITDFNGMTIR